MDKKLLAVAVGAIVSANALATPVLIDTASPYAYETLPVSNAGTGTLLGTPVNASDIGTGVTTDNQIFVRVDVSGGTKFAGSPSVLVDGASSNTIAQGGNGSAFVIFSSTAGAGNILQNSNVNVTMGNLTVPGQSAASGVTVCTYETLSQAVNQTGSLGCDTNAAYLSMMSGLLTTATPSTQTASVDADYMKFLDPAGGATPVLTVPLGTHNVAHNPNTLNAVTGANVAALAELVVLGNANLTTNSAVTYTGDFSIGNFAINTAADCTGGTLFDIVEKVNNVVQPSGSAALADVNTGTLCVTVGGTTAIPVTDYKVAINFVGITGNAQPVDIGATAFGSIVRDGTQIEVDYMTTFSGYNQRVIMTNRGARDYTYETTFSTEAGVTATPGAAATGTLKAGEVTVVRVADMVTFTGGTRGSAVITIPATSGTVDAATTQVNLSDGGTDTVYLD